MINNIPIIKCTSISMKKELFPWVIDLISLILCFMRIVPGLLFLNVLKSYSTRLP